MTVIILVDNDANGAGEQAARALGERLAAMGRHVRLAMPELPDGRDHADWNNVHQEARGDEAGLTVMRAAILNAPEVLVVREAMAEATRGAAGASAPQSGGSGNKPKQTDMLLRMAAAAELFHTPKQEAYATIERDGHQETYAINSSDFRSWITLQFYRAQKSAPNREAALRAAIDTLAAKARFEGEQHEVHSRVARFDDGTIYVDLCNDAREAVEIDVRGWRVVPRPPVRFIRSRAMLPLPNPRSGHIDELRPLVNLHKDAAFVFAVGFLLGALSGRGPYIALAVLGEQGSSKTTLLEMLRNLVNPHDLLCGDRHVMKNLSTSPRSTITCCFDNISTLPDWLSDAFCCVVSGTGMGTRQLYTNEGEVLFKAMRPISFNGIGEFIRRGDLDDRCLALVLEPIGDAQRKTAAELAAAFKAAHPRILGALCTMLSRGLADWPTVRTPSLPRMADAARWITACEAEFWERGRFLAYYREYVRGHRVEQLEADLLAVAIRRLVARQSFRGTAAELLAELSGNEDEPTRKKKDWPKDAWHLSRQLPRIAPLLRAADIEVVTLERHARNGATLFVIENVARRHGNHPTEVMASRDSGDAPW